MTLILINTFLMIITCVLMYYSTNLLSKNDNNTILLTKILPSKINEPEILDIIRRFKKDNLRMTILFAIMYTPCYLMGKYTAFSIIYMVLWVFIICLFTALLTKKYITEIRTLKREKGWYITKKVVLSVDTNGDDVIFYDDDEYWGCFFYNNPNDSSMMVETRNGMGTTVNIGSKAGKGFVIGVSIFTLTILLFTFILIIKLDNASFSLKITNNTTAKIEAPLYAIEFNLDDIENIDRISKLPKGVRTNGSSTDSIKLGNFKFEEYGATKFYVHADINDIIVIKLSDKYIFLNGETYKETEEYYNILKENS